jgi:hypothetical protein
VAFNTIPPNDFGHYGLLDAQVQLEGPEALDTELAGQFAALGIVKDEKFAPDTRLRAILDEAVAVGNAASRTLGMGAHPTEGFRYYEGDSAWWISLWVGGFEFTDPPPQLGPVPPRIQAEHPNGASVRGAQALDDLHRGGLPGPVGPQDPEDLAPLHGEGQVVDRDPAAVLLVQVIHLDDRHAGRLLGPQD